MENNYCLYKHTTPSDKVYIGITLQKPEDRWEGGNGYNRQVFYRAIQKYGWENIKHEVLFSGLSEAEAKCLEIELIAKYKANDPSHGYNVATGGDCHEFNEVGRERVSEGVKRDYEEHPEKRKHLSERRKQYYKDHPEAIERLREQHIGRKASDETRAKMSNAKKGVAKSPETCKKLSEAKKGWNPSEETRKNMSIAARNRVERLKNEWESQGKTAKDAGCTYDGLVERLSQFAAEKRKPVIGIDKETGQKQLFGSITVAAETTGIKMPNIIRCLKGGRQSAGGFFWEYAEKSGDKEG